jgi:hypothetical protein
MEPTQLLVGLAGIAIVVALYWGFAMFMRKRFVILYHSQALTELVTELRRIATALERAHPDPVQLAQLQPTDGTHSVANSMFGR